jgi:hypothetical protein
MRRFELDHQPARVADWNGAVLPSAASRGSHFYDFRGLAKLFQVPGSITGARKRRNRLREQAGQCEESPGEPVSGWISAAIMPLEPGPNRTSTY